MLTTFCGLYTEIPEDEDTLHLPFNIQKMAATSLTPAQITEGSY
jgi:hypothetical protein